MTKRRRWLVILLVTAVVGAIAWAVWPPSDQPYLDMVAALRAAGEPVDYDGLAGPIDADAEAAGAELMTARDWLHSEANVPHARWDDVVGPWNIHCEADWPETSTPEQMAELTKLLDSIAPYRAQIAAAAAKPRLLEPRQPRGNFGFPETNFIPSVQEAHRVLSAAAVGSADAASRLDAIVLLAEIGNRMDARQLVHQAVAGASVLQAAKEVRRGLESGRLDPVAARARLDPLLRTRWLDRFPSILRGDRTFAITSYATLVAGDFPGREPSFPEKVADSFLKLFGKSKPASSWPITFVQPTRQEVVDECVAYTAALKVPLGPYAEYRAALVRALSVPDSRPAVAVGPMYGRALRAFCRNDAAQRLARIALAAAEHRATHGDFPASLDELKPMFPDGLPLDPFNEAPFVYERTATGVRIASAGRFADDPDREEDPAVVAADLVENALVWELKK